MVTEFETIQPSQHKPNLPFTQPPRSGYKENHVRHTKKKNVWTGSQGMGMLSQNSDRTSTLRPEEPVGAMSWSPPKSPGIRFHAPTRVGYSDLPADHSEKNPGSEGI